ncbi:MAG: LysR family transcriptional regulator [Syntrophobacteraceae bacterium]|jgi:molybdate transport system regulatory protein|nr:LysR family transcriptional regulator [Syntrophobacteraceae bacterium]
MIPVHRDDEDPNAGKAHIPVMRIRLWLETPKGLYFGLGRAQLLKKVGEHGSLKKAAEDLGMSYRAAWGKIKKTEEILGVQLIEQVGCKRDGYRLTEIGRAYMEDFLSWFEEVEQTALERARMKLPWPVRGYMC